MEDNSIVVNLQDLSREQLGAMAEAAREVVECHRVLAKTGDNLVGELLRGHENFFEWDHYPPGDVYDGESHGQYSYHARRPAPRGNAGASQRRAIQPA